jgi:hypothetical protein
MSKQINYETNLFRRNLSAIIEFFTIEKKRDGSEYIPAIFTHSGMKYTGNDEFLLNEFKYSRTAENGYASFLVSQRHSRQEYLLLGNEQTLTYYDRNNNEFSGKNFLSLTKKYLDKMSLSENCGNMPNICLVTDETIYEIDGKAILNKWTNKEIYADSEIIYIMYDDCIIRSEKNLKENTELSALQIYRRNDLKKAVIANLLIKGTDYIYFRADIYDKEMNLKRANYIFPTIKDAISQMKLNVSERTIKRRIVDNKPIETEHSIVILHK